MNIHIEKIIERDDGIIRQLKRIETQAFGEAGLNEWMLVPLIRHGRVFALFDGQRIIGGAQFVRDWDDSARAYLVGIAVDRDERGKGLGARFLSGCLDELRSEGVGSVELTVDAANAPAVSVYREKLGFETIGTRKDEYGAGNDRVVMERRI
jgi:ribosomal-protein-alanine N-acetyltransferase